MNWSHLLSPTHINGLQLPNRVVLPGMDMNHCVDGVISQHEIDHYAARAAGGCALVITGASAIAWPLGATSRKQPALSDDRFLPGLRALAGAVHDNGSRLCLQLVHHGKVAGVDTADDRPQLVPSVPPDRLDLSALADCPMDELMRMASATQGKPATYQVATHDDIRWVIDRFAEAADRVKRAGADAVEIHGAHGYLISTFLSRAYNLRDDEYGGSLENRSRILVEVIGAVRATVGADYPILVRLNGCEYGIDNGITPDETAATARIAELAGADAVHISANAANPFRDFTKGPLPSEVGQYREMAKLAKAAVGIPVIAVGRLLPELAEEMLAGGECDLVSMGRQQLADPQLVNKIKAGRRASVRPCINCYVCVEQNFYDSNPLCAVNPALGNEPAAAAQVAVAIEPRRVVVVGGGPAGLEAARIAAQRGHRVTLLEKGDELGGATWFAVASASANSQLVDWLRHEVAEVGVDIRTGTQATVATITELAPDIVIIATGAGGSSTRSMIAARELIASDRRDGNDVSDGRNAHPVTVIGGDMVGLSLARFLAKQGHEVTVLERGPHFGAAMALPRRWSEVRAAGDDGITLVRNATEEQIAAAPAGAATGGAATATSPTGPAALRIVTDDWQPDTRLADELAAAGLTVHVIGDAAGVGYIKGAMHSAHAIATVI